ncbi:hypothetical protein OSB04_015430 [Centaurea solstitialis]|uniref:TIR domain-containing protein n=1 Tax=Centaurea solstitialis TaxID=347529 RepID=A0AA38SZ09_9ASTR|nr:hypothetical protein OSB04_015430 [Centaurea solstitialis]
MASSSINKKSFKYDVFLSFRGEDTRKNFVDHLYYALQQKSIHTYKDDERIKKGERINDELIKSIQDSRFHIIVFSKNYASSSWCLDELVQIIECQKTAEYTAYPVFYDVGPSEVRKPSGEFEKAFVKHETLEKWSEALKEAASLAGWELKNTLDGHEAKFIQKIVEEISLQLRPINSSVDEKLIGMDTRIKDVVSSLELGFDDVRMIGIKGMGGGGKTTLAKAVFDQICNEFEGISFVENVREVSKPNFSGLKKLQKQVLRDVLNDQAIVVPGVLDGKTMMKKKMAGRKVLIVLDDVDHIHQLEVLAGEPNWFKPGSRIIITTRDEQVLIAHGVLWICDVNLLSNQEAIFLFSRYAFGKEIPIHGYEELSRRVVGYAVGLPLTIKVLGSFLCGKNELEWTDALERLKTIPLKETLKKLELSYIDLEEDYKEIFLDVACILRYWMKDDAIIVLESCGFHARNGLRVLEQRSLIKISKYGTLGMHDHIEELGMNIVRRLHPDEPNKHSRLWIEEEIGDVLADDMKFHGYCFWIASQGTKATRYIKLITSKVNPETIMKGLGNMKNLRCLRAYSGQSDSFHSNWTPDEVTQYFPNALRYLRWDSYPFRFLPKTFQANNLVTLHMHGSGIVQLWEGEERKVLNKLRFLDLGYTKLKTLDLGMTPNLETLSLEECSNLVELHMSVECLKLVSINLSNSKLRTLDLRRTLNLEIVSLVACIELEELHMPVESLKLRSLDLSSSKLRTLDLGATPNIKTLSLRRCDDLVKFHMSVECPQLRILDLSHSKLRTLDLRLTPNLESLSLTECYRLVELHIPIGCLKKLSNLDLSGCLRFKSFSFKQRFESLKVGSLSELHLILESLDTCPLHPDNTLPKFRFTCFYEEHVPSSTGNLEKLISIGMCACTNLERFSRNVCGLQCLTKLTLEGGIPEAPKDLGQLECLVELSLSTTRITHLPDSICMLKHLKLLELKSCWLLEKLPEDLGLLECLEELILSECIYLRDIPNGICKMKRLKYFHLLHCFQVEKLPEEFGCLKCLKVLNIEGTGISHLPRSIFSLKGLRIVGFRWLLESFGFVSVIQLSGSVAYCSI